MKQVAYTDTMHAHLHLVLFQQEAQLSPSDRAMRLVSSNLASYDATVQKLWRQCVINKQTTVELCISPLYRRLAVANFSKSTMKKLLT